MSTIALSGADTIMLNKRVLADLADGDVADLTFPTDIATVKTGKNGNSIYGLNETGKQADFKLRIIRGSADDKFMNNLIAQQQSNFAETVLIQGTFVKKIGDGLGNISLDTYIVSGGIMTKQVEGKTNVEGDALQSVAMYTIKFSNAPRILT